MIWLLWLVSHVDFHGSGKGLFQTGALRRTVPQAAAYIKKEGLYSLQAFIIAVINGDDTNHSIPNAFQRFHPSSTSLTQRLIATNPKPGVVKQPPHVMDKLQHLQSYGERTHHRGLIRLHWLLPPLVCSSQWRKHQLLKQPSLIEPCLIYNDYLGSNHVLDSYRHVLNSDLWYKNYRVVFTLNSIMNNMME